MARASKRLGFQYGSPKRRLRHRPSTYAWIGLMGDVLKLLSLVLTTHCLDGSQPIFKPYAQNLVIPRFLTPSPHMQAQTPGAYKMLPQPTGVRAGPRQRAGDAGRAASARDSGGHAADHGGVAAAADSAEGAEGGDRRAGRR
eukprot:161239-Chlamydomonas_euryale.AAC.1